ncbi:hypothetical protein N399_23925 (plasmid) [Bacillus licheniformis CG-B52]|uniref:hypothetical protein n=1 Tax=Bacillus licheniformis TaxID=1402 RepID=UPI00038E70F1|nr:hypothetical protein [Bacillus licheniformis]EQM25306.1 hypothetical protein N399_23925 [Bacillus licheniformis CG-B52]
MNNMEFVKENINKCLEKLTKLRIDGNHSAYKTFAKALREYIAMFNHPNKDEAEHLSKVIKLVLVERQGLESFIRKSFDEEDFKAYYSLSNVYEDINKMLIDLVSSVNQIEENLDKHEYHNYPITGNNL